MAKHPAAEWIARRHLQYISALAWDKIVLSLPLRVRRSKSHRMNDLSPGQSPSTREPDLASVDRRQITWISTALFSVLMVILVFGPAKIALDSKWVIPTALSIIRGNAGDISQYVRTSGREATTTRGERRYNFFPVGTALLSIPAVAVIAAIDPGLTDKVIRSDAASAQKIIASMFGALAAVVFFWLIYARFRSTTMALASTFVFMFCTSMWSIATRALWAHAPLVLLVTIAMLLLVRARSRPALAQYVSLPLAVAFIVRPSAAAPIVAFSLYVLLVHRIHFIKYVAWSAAIAVPWISFNLWAFGTLFPEYYFHSHMLHDLPFWEGLGIQLFSPNRGLFVFSPVLLFALSGFALAIKERDDRGLHFAFAATIILHLVLVSRHHTWWAGWSFGPRFMIDVLPFLVYFFAFNLRAIVPIDNARKAVVAAVIGLFAVVSMAIHGLGAYRGAPDRWNAWPTDIDRTPARVWDWNDLQFTRGIPFVNPEPRTSGGDRPPDSNR